jgi:hypothetical protein
VEWEGEGSRDIGKNYYVTGKERYKKGVKPGAKVYGRYKFQEPSSSGSIVSATGWTTGQSRFDPRQR